MKVQIPAEQIDQKVQSKLQQLARTVRLDGFRPGKVPLSVVRDRYEPQVRSETVSELIVSTYEQALQQENLTPVAEPNIEQTANQPGQELEYVATFEVYPDIDLPAFSEITLQRPVSEVRDADVDKMLEKLCKQRVTWEKVERPATQGDRLEIDFSGTIDGAAFSGNSGKNVPLELGSGSMIPGFEDQLIGAGAGEVKTIEVVFPADYGSQEVAGKTAQFVVTVNAVAEAALPELNDDFARTFGVGDGGLEKLREEVRENMRRELDAVIKTRVKQQVFDLLLEKSAIDVPEALVEREIDALVKKDDGSADAEADRSRHEQEAKRRVGLGMLVAELMKRNQLEADPERVRHTIETLAQSYEKPEEVVQWYYSNQEMLAGIQTLVMEDTVVDWITEQTQVEDKPITFEELMQA
jgi:trigger factor